jgi:hypothetical protein
LKDRKIREEDKEKAGAATTAPAFVMLEKGE